MVLPSICGSVTSGAAALAGRAATELCAATFCAPRVKAANTTAVDKNINRDQWARAGMADIEISFVLELQGGVCTSKQSSNSTIFVIFFIQM